MSWSSGARRKAGGRPRTLRAALAATVVLAVGCGDEHPSAPSREQSSQATVTLGASGLKVPRSFLGVTADPPEVADDVRAAPAFGRAVGQIQPWDGSPMILRVGGKSGDFLYWRHRGRHDPAWIVHAGPRFLAGVTSLARANGYRVSLGLNLAAHAPAMALAYARAARRALPPGALVELSIGNEPDVYHRHPKLERERVPGTLPGTPRHWTRGYSQARYRRDFLAYARVLRAARLGVPLAGPETAHVPWRDALAPLGRGGPEHLVIHRYALTACPGPRSPLYPTIARLLAPSSSTGMASDLVGMARRAHAAGRTLRVTEFAPNSCPGPHGVSDAFATALWAPDALFSLMAAGVDGVNAQLRTEQRNSPLAIRGRAVHARPALYGEALFARAIGSGARLVRLSTRADGALRLRAWAVRSTDAARVLLINKGPRAASVAVRDPDAPPASARVLRLTAPSVRATSGVRLGGRSIGPDGKLSGPEVTSSVARDGDAVRVRVPGFSAALVTLAR